MKDVLKFQESKAAKIARLENTLRSLAGRISQKSQSTLTTDANKSHVLGLRMVAVQAELDFVKESVFVPSPAENPEYQALKAELKAISAKQKEIREAKKALYQTLKG